jgi:hypothetical protein
MFDNLKPKDRIEASGKPVQKQANQGAALRLEDNRVTGGSLITQLAKPKKKKASPK